MNAQCYYCKKAPAFQSSNGIYSAYCCKSHMLRDVKDHPDEACIQCGQKPQFVENGYRHPYCSKECGQKAQSGVPRSREYYSSKDKCIACGRGAFVGLSGRASQFCSNSCRKCAVERGIAHPCLFCLRNPQERGQDFCSVICGSNAFDQAPLVLPSLPESSADYLSVKNQFEQSWRHEKKPVPTIIAISKIVNDRQSMKVYQDYRAQVENQGCFLQKGMSAGNECLRFHGTVRGCSLGDPESTLDQCDHPLCNLCGIIGSSFNHAMAGSRVNFGRFGRGIYTTSTSSKADDYSSSLQSPYKTVLLNRVVVGSALKLTQNHENLRSPPRGYNSVIGEPGDDLNYDELVVYSNDAIRPAFLIVYQ